MIAILQTVVERDVEFVVIGAVAVGHRGYPRATNDVDIVPSPAPPTSRRSGGGARRAEARPFAIDDVRADELPAPFSLVTLQQGGNWDLTTTHGRLDIVQYRERALETPDDYRRLRAGAISGQHRFAVVWFAGYDDLIDLKTLTGRDQDLIDIRALREAHDDTAP